MKSLWENLPQETLNEIGRVHDCLTLTKKGNIMQSMENCVTALLNDPIFKDAIKLNEWSERTDIVKYVGWKKVSPPMTDTDMRHIFLYLEKFYEQRVTQNIIHAIDVVASQCSYHPIRNYLESIQWDGTERIRYALHHFLGAGTDDLTYECFKVFLLGALRRIYHPGCKFEIMLCLIGDQGVGKSSFFRHLALKDEWFSDDLKHLDDENVYRKMQGHWIIEMAEMLGTASAKSVEEIKAFLSRQSETYKVPYDRLPQDRPRQCVFVGTTNKQRFLPLDRTGNRRFFPIQTDASQAEAHVLDDPQETKEYMRQLWAEALVLYNSGEHSPTLSKELEHKLDVYRCNFMAEDTATGMIQAWLDTYKGDYVCTKMIYQETYHGFGEPDRKTISEINDVMNNTIDGWTLGPQHRFDRYGQQRSWMRVELSTVNEASRNDGLVEMTGDLVQLGVPEEWLRPK